MAEYFDRIADLCLVYDRLVGIKSALLGEAGHRALEIPLFRLTPYAEIAMHRHGAASGTGDPRPSALQSQAAWTQALDKLLASPDADISALIGVAA